MKTESPIRYTLRIALTLLAIAVVVAAALAIVNELTAPAIEKSMKEKTQAAIELVLGPGETEAVQNFSKENGLVSNVYKSEAGYAVEVNPTGFDGTITMMVGVSAEGKVLGISIISHTESAGLGAVAADKGSKGEKFRKQFSEQTYPVSVKKDGGAIDSITGATITSKAVCDGVNAALSCVAKLEGGAL